VVQGVGYRPYVYKIATTLNLTGYVQNNSNALIIEIEGDTQKIKEFDTLITTTTPPLAIVENITKKRDTKCK
jgi:hydrogenase maturation protein HypF